MAYEHVEQDQCAKNKTTIAKKSSLIPASVLMTKTLVSMFKSTIGTMLSTIQTSDMRCRVKSLNWTLYCIVLVDRVKKDYQNCSA